MIGGINSLNKILRILKNEYIFSIISKVMMVLIGMINSILIARFLGPELKGELTVITSITSISSILFTFGIHQSYPYYRKQSEDNSLLNRFMTAILFLFSIYLVLGIIICLFMSNVKYIKYIVTLTIIMSYSRISGYIYLVEEPNKKNLSLMMINIIEVIYIIILFTLFRSNLSIAILITAFKDTLQSVYYTYKLDIRVSLKNIDINILLKMIKYGFYPMVGLLMSTLNYRIDILMLKSSSNVSVAEIGIYSIGVALAEKLWIVSDAVKDILLSRLSKGKGTKEVAIVMRLTFFISIFMVIGIILLGYPFINILYGNEYSGAYNVTVIIVFGIISMVFYKIISTYNIVHGKQKTNVILLGSSIIINIISNLVMIPIMGYKGAAVASVVSYSMCSILFLIIFSKDSGIDMKKLILVQKEDFLIIKNANKMKQTAC